MALPDARDLYTSQAWFEHEQRALRRDAWRFVGLASDLAHDDDWVRATLFDRDVFVQRFGDSLRAFDNLCAHRGAPIRREARGNGPVRCGFHGWTYDAAGVPVGIPRNPALFGLDRAQREALALPAYRVAAIGELVFASAGATELVAELGELAGVLAAVAPLLGPVVLRERTPLAANWKHFVEITLDDYHVRAVHPTTFGPLHAEELFRYVYRRSGRHSSHMGRRDVDWSYDYYWRDVGAGKLDRTGTKTFQVFPDALFATSPALFVAQIATPVDAGHTTIESIAWSWADVPLPDARRDDQAAFLRQVTREDLAMCEALQSASSRAERPQLLGKLEERVGWFREAYAAAVR